tara:strand:+ start:283 stop:576 length:294 start_codon:yes stop_codon:yes gene_type:complete
MSAGHCEKCQAGVVGQMICKFPDCQMAAVRETALMRKARAEAMVPTGRLRFQDRAVNYGDHTRRKKVLQQEFGPPVTADADVNAEYREWRDVPEVQG